MARQLEYRGVQFDVPAGEFRNLKVFKPELPEGWFYLGPVALNSDAPGNQTGLIVRAEHESALGNIVDWNPVFIDIEGGQFSTWRGVPEDPRYVVGGDVFVRGIKKPTAEQVAGIKAIHGSLVSGRRPNHQIVGIRLPKAIATFWDVRAVDRLHVTTGAFASTGGDDPDVLTIPVILFNA